MNEISTVGLDLAKNVWKRSICSHGKVHLVMPI
jgi:hypothetical protein